MGMAMPMGDLRSFTIHINTQSKYEKGYELFIAALWTYTTMDARQTLYIKTLSIYDSRTHQRSGVDRHSALR